MEWNFGITVPVCLHQKSGLFPCSRLAATAQARATSWWCKVRAALGAQLMGPLGAKSQTWLFLPNSAPWLRAASAKRNGNLSRFSGLKGMWFSY